LVTADRLAPLAHLILLALWAGVVAAELVLEDLGRRNRELRAPAARIHLWIDLLVELPLVLGVLASGVVLAALRWPLSPVHWAKIALAAVAIVANLICIALVIRRHRRQAHGLTRRLIPLVAVGLPAALLAAGLGFALAAQRGAGDLLAGRRAEVAELRELLSRRWSNKHLDEPRNEALIQRLFGQIDSDLQGDPDRYIGRLDRIIRRLHDGHLRLEPGATVRQVRRFSGMTVRRVAEGFALVACTYPENCRGLALPQLVRAIDGQPAAKWLARDAELQYGSSDHGRLAAAIDGLRFHRRLTYYAPPRTLELEDLQGKLRQHRVVWRQKDQGPRHQRWKNPKRRCVEGRRVGQSFTLRVSTFTCRLAAGEDDARALAHFEAQLTAAVGRYRGEPRVILDLRGNGGGNDPEGRMIAGLFVDRTQFWFRISHLLRASSVGMRLWRLFDGEWQEPFTATFEPNQRYRAKFKDARLLVLTDSRCYSTCDGVVAALKHAGAGRVVGSRTHGGSGDPTRWTAPHSGFRVVHPTALVWQKDGSLIEGNGVAVDRELLPSVRDYLASEDPVLKMAAELP